MSTPATDATVPFDRNRFTQQARMIALVCSLLSIVASIITLSIIPLNSDLYNLLYENSRPEKPEGTVFFLLVFPLFLLGGFCSIGWTDLNGQNQVIHSRLAKIGLYVLFYGWITFFFVAAIMRDVTAITHYFA